MKIALYQRQKLIYHRRLLISINVNVQNIIVNWLEYFNLEISLLYNLFICCIICCIMSIIIVAIA